METGQGVGTGAETGQGVGTMQGMEASPVSYRHNFLVSFHFLLSRSKFSGTRTLH